MNDVADTADDSGPVFRLIYSSHSRIAPDHTTTELGESSPWLAGRTRRSA